MRSTLAWTLALLPLSALLVTGCGRGDDQDVELLNVSYDPTRELWREINAAFIPLYEERTGQRLTISQSHGGSGTLMTCTPGLTKSGQS